MFNDYEGGRSSAAELESHNPYFDSSNVSCTATSCEDDEVVSLDGSCSLSVTSIRLDPEVDALNNVYCEFNLVGGKVYVGLNDGSCTPSESTLDYEVCGGAGSCSGSFYYSITKDMLYDNRPTYLVLVVERSCTYPTCDAATFYVKGIKPEWIDVGIATEGGGMSEDSCGNWEFTGESCTDTTESESQTSAGGGMSGMNNWAGLGHRAIDSSSAGNGRIAAPSPLTIMPRRPARISRRGPRYRSTLRLVCSCRTGRSSRLPTISYT
jgi:hypothetical protein